MLRVLLVVALVTLPSCVNARRINRNTAKTGTEDVLSVGEKKEVMRGSSEEHANYKYVQQVGLSLYTFPEGFAKAGVQAFYEGIDNSVLKTTQQGHGTVDIDNMDDVRQRVKIMKDMMEVAYQSQYYERDESVLKIFMAPEFFFRGPHGAYDMRNLAGCPQQYRNFDMCDRPVITILQLLSEAVQDDKWKDWVFVPGTIVSFIGDAVGKIHYFNFAPVLRGGSGDTKHHIVAKTFVSGIDFLDCPNGIGADGGFCVENPEKLGTGFYAPFAQDQEQELARYGFEVQQKNKFTTAGIQFGLEVCLDHAQKKLAEHRDGVQVHLIVSAGMAIQWTVPKLPGAAYNAPVFLQDGGSGGAHTQYYCPGCPFLDTRGLWPSNSNPPDIVQSPQPQESFEAHKYNASMFPSFYPVGQDFTTPPSVNQWYSPKGFGTEGSGLGTDPRFASENFHHIFAKDDFKPKINIGPAFEVPVYRSGLAPPQLIGQPIRQPQAGPGRFFNQPKPGPVRFAPPVLLPKPVVNPVRFAPLVVTDAYACHCKKNWDTRTTTAIGQQFPSQGACHNACCPPAVSTPFGWCITSGTCNGRNWKACASNTEPRIA